MMFLRTLPIALFTLALLLLGVLLFCLGSGPLLGSWWAALPLATMLPVFVRRTLLEDRMLQAELVGYVSMRKGFAFAWCQASSEHSQTWRRTRAIR
jgi:hypothetical protein